MASIRKRSWTSGGAQHTAWVVDYVDQHGKRRLKTFERKKDADAWRTTALHEIGQGIHTAPAGSKTLKEIGALWLKHCEAEGLEPGTVKQREQILRLHVNPLLGATKLAELTAPRVATFMDELRDRDVSVAMRRKILTNLKTMITYAQARGHVAQNVARSVRAPADRRGDVEADDDEVTIPTKDELRRMIEASPAPRWRAFVVTAIFTGLRASELRGLRWQDVDLEAGILHVRQRADYAGRMGPPKSRAGRRDVPLAPMVVNALKEWRLACPRLDGDLWFVFPNGAGKVESHANIANRFFLPLQVSLGIAEPTRKVDDDEPVLRARYGLHALRHAAASLFIEQGWPVKKVQTVLGHATAAMTMDTYGHLFKDAESDRQAMEKMQAALIVPA